MKERRTDVETRLVGHNSNARYRLPAMAQEKKKTDSDEPKMSVKEAGRKGGQAVKARYGSEFYEQIGRKGGQATMSTHGVEFYENIGRLGGKKGGESTRKRYGPKFYEEIGRAGGQKVKKLIEDGKRATNND
jgi:uncharacterized protein